MRECTKSTAEDILRSKTLRKSGVVGLSNLGNTCFMNSGLQCLSNIYELTRYFLDKRYLAEINKKNALGTGGALAEAYYRFVSEVWTGTGETVQPSYVKRALADINPIYAGYMQHDAQEVISLILDILHEDLNRVKRKPYIATKDYLAEDSFVAGVESWENYLRRNQSVVVDLLHGMYKSALYCPLCKNTFLAFDPFCVLNLPIPPVKKITEVSVFYVPYGVQEFPLKIMVPLDDSETIAEFRKKAADRLGIDPESFIVSVSTFYIKRLLNKSCSAGYLRSVMNATANSYYVMLYQVAPSVAQTMSPEGGYDAVVVPLLFGFYNERISRMEHTTYARVLFLNKKATTAKIYHEVFRYVKDYVKLIYKKMANRETEKNEESDETPKKDEDEVLFNKLFPVAESSLSTSLTSYFTLQIVNNQPRDSVCPFCEDPHCKNCPLEYSDTVTLEALLTRMESGSANEAPNRDLYEAEFQRSKVFELEIVWSEIGKEQVVPRVNKYDEPKPTKEHPRHPQRKISLYDCFDQFVLADTLDEKNKWYCTKCKQHVQATKSMMVYRAPPILVLALKRFKNFSCGMKITELIDFPLKNLDISKYIDSSCNGSSTSPDSPVSRGSQQPGPTKRQYDLFAVSNHYGSLGGGHYTAFALNAEYGKWFSFDDSRVSAVINEQDVVTPAAYVLFYRRQDVDPTNIKYEDFLQTVRVENNR